MGLDLLELIGADQGAHLGIPAEPGRQPQPLDRAHELGAELVIDPLIGVDPLDVDAELPGIVEHGAGGTGRG